jgi:hypothetical protein
MPLISMSEGIKAARAPRNARTPRETAARISFAFSQPKGDRT